MEAKKAVTIGAQEHDAADLKLEAMSATNVKQWKQKESVSPFMQETSAHPTIVKISHKST
jgi:hypothetical protein